LFVPVYPLHAEAGQVIGCYAKADAAGNIPGAGLVPLVAFGQGELPSLHRFHNPASQQERLDHRLLHPEHTGTGRAEHLMAGEGTEVTTELEDIDRYMRDGL